jgi:hypothetical protein
LVQRWKKKPSYWLAKFEKLNMLEQQNIEFKQELTGASLNEILLKKSGKTWDDVIESRANFDDIDEKTA